MQKQQFAKKKKKKKKNGVSLFVQSVDICMNFGEMFRWHFSA